MLRLDRVAHRRWFLPAVAAFPLSDYLLLDTLPGETADDSVVRETMATIEDYGLWVLVGLSLLSWPPRAAVLACALVGLPPWAIALAVLAGRPIPAVGLALTGAKAPHLLRRFRTIDPVLADVEANRTAPRCAGGTRKPAVAAAVSSRPRCPTSYASRPNRWRGRT
jgi:hypothetical protein